MKCTFIPFFSDLLIFDFKLWKMGLDSPELQFLSRADRSLEITKRLICVVITIQRERTAQLSCVFRVYKAMH